MRNRIINRAAAILIAIAGLWQIAGCDNGKTKEANVMKSEKEEQVESYLQPDPDLQGGAHITLQFELDKILIGLSGNNNSKLFRSALAEAKHINEQNPGDFVSAFAAAWGELKASRNSSERMADVFYEGSEGLISTIAQDVTVVEMLKAKVEEKLKRSEMVIWERISGIGVSDPKLEVDYKSGICVVKLPGIKDGSRVAGLLTRSGKLEFREVYKNSPDMFNRLVEIDTLIRDTKFPGFIDSVKKVNKQGVFDIDDDWKLSPLFEIFRPYLQLDEQTNQYYIVPAGYIGFAVPKDTARVMGYFRMKEVMAKLPGPVKYAWSAKGDENDIFRFYLLDVSKRSGEAFIDGSSVSDARVEMDQMGTPEVSITMNREGAEKWRKMTKIAAQNQDNIAILIDDRVVTAPVVSQEIQGGTSVISGGFSYDEAHELASIFRAGQLEIPLHIVEYTWDKNL